VSNSTIARAFAEAGIAIFPCRADNKRPLIKWRAGSTCDHDQVIAWWRRWPLALVGLDLDKCGLVVFDCDRHEGCADGVANFVELVRQHDADLSAVPVVRTPSNGLHLYFRQPPGEPLGNREGDLPDGINVRGRGGLTIAPGCSRPDSQGYFHVAKQPPLLGARVPIVPAWLVEIIQARPMRANARFVTYSRPTYTLSTTRRQAAWASAALDRCSAAVAGTPNGHRNKALNGVAFRLGRIVARGWLDRGEVEQRLRAAADGCGLVKDDGLVAVAGTIASGLNAGERDPVPDLV
jgi:Bifunctional DNA primase/polymerase, N-terminal